MDFFDWLKWLRRFHPLSSNKSRDLRALIFSVFLLGYLWHFNQIYLWKPLKNIHNSQTPSFQVPTPRRCSELPAQPGRPVVMLTGGHRVMCDAQSPAGPWTILMVGWAYKLTFWLGCLWQFDDIFYCFLLRYKSNSILYRQHITSFVYIPCKFNFTSILRNRINKRKDTYTDTDKN